MVKVRTAKAKGRNLEYDAQASLEQIYPNVTRTAERGYSRQYDLEVRNHETLEIIAIIECKRLKTASWNQLTNIYEKLKTKIPQKAPKTTKTYLIFKNNQQPCLVYHEIEEAKTIQTFKQVFGVPFIKHENTKKWPT